LAVAGLLDMQQQEITALAILAEAQPVAAVAQRRGFTWVLAVDLADV
jgi:hypothetical protein